MDEIIQIKCPFCGAVLSVRNQPGIETKNVTCPICKHRYPFSQFKRVQGNGASEDPDTEYPDGGRHSGGLDDHPRYVNEEKTEIGEQPNYTLGRVKVVGSGRSYQLNPGRNIIGRCAQKSEANFQLDTGEKRSMSREHIVIEVKKLPAKGFVHFVSLFKEKVNKTFIGNETLLFGDCVVLKHGDMIRLPDATLRFEIPDGEETEL